MSFNPVYFLYLNPTLCVEQSIFSVEQARDFWNSNSNTASNVLSNMDILPTGFNAQTYLNKIIDRADFSQLNGAIYTTMLQNYSVTELNKRGTFFPNIYRSVISQGSNTFSFDLPGTLSNITINSSNLNVGDVVQLRLGKTNLCSTVTSIVDSDTFTLNSNITVPLDQTALLYGIKLYDVDRIAHINYSRLFTSNIPTSIGSNFNPYLYKLLYPDTGILTNDDAYTDYLAKKGSRIGSVFDLAKGTAGSNAGILECNVSSLTVTNHLNLDFDVNSGKVTWAGTDLYYITTDHTRKLNQLSAFTHGLVSEYAIKKWTHDLFWPAASFNTATFKTATFSNIVVPSTGQFDVSCITSSNLTIKGSTVFTSNVEFESSVIISDILQGGRIGIGTANAFEMLSTIDSNILAANVNIEDTLYVRNNTQLDGHVLCSNISMKGDLTCGSRIGIGPVDFQTYRSDFEMSGPYYGMTTFNVPGDTIINGDLQISGTLKISKIHTDCIVSMGKISSFTNIDANDFLIGGIHSNLTNILYNTSTRLGIPYEHVTTTRDVIALVTPQVYQTDSVSRIYVSNVPHSADFVVFDTGAIYKILSIKNDRIEVMSTSLPAEVNIIKYNIINEKAILVGRCLFEMTKQLNALARYHSS